jgi:hypothetical protein
MSIEEFSKRKEQYENLNALMNKAKGKFDASKQLAIDKYGTDSISEIKDMLKQKRNRRETLKTKMERLDNELDRLFEEFEVKE